MKICKVKGCFGKVRCKELCNNCYSRLTTDHYKNDRRPIRRFKRAKINATKKGIKWNISYKYWHKLIVNNKCHYCDESLPETGYGLDRIKPNGNYTHKNIVPCCKKCNMTKTNRYTYQEFKIMMNALKEYKNERKGF